MTSQKTIQTTQCETNRLDGHLELQKRVSRRGNDYEVLSVSTWRETDRGNTEPFTVTLGRDAIEMLLTSRGQDALQACVDRWIAQDAKRAEELRARAELSSEAVETLEAF